MDVWRPCPAERATQGACNSVECIDRDCRKLTAGRREQPAERKPEADATEEESQEQGSLTRPTL